MESVEVRPLGVGAWSGLVGQVLGDVLRDVADGAFRILGALVDAACVDPAQPGDVRGWGAGFLQFVERFTPGG
nr:hypothetical protein [Micromonospora sp. Llam0]